MEVRCLGCMEKFPDSLKVCPNCGHVVGTKAEEPIHMDPGTLLYDRYIIGRVLGYGGFGVTYIAWDNKLDQPVAIKEYLPGEFSTRMPGRTQITILGGAKEEQFRSGLDKFVDEAKRLSKFPGEDGIVRIIDTFRENDTAYLVMEYLDGVTLKEYIQEHGIIPEDIAVEMLMPIMKSLEVVHAEGLIHRDIAPDNIFITKDGKVKLIDFGASRYATTTHSRSLTVLVKPGYSPEEQYRSRGDQGPYTDVYALSATMYKMMTGKTPPDALDRRALYESKNKDIVVPMHKLNKHITRNRENAILNGMNVKIEDRTPDIASFISELEADPPVKRRYGTIKKIDIYSWPLWLKIVVPIVMVLLIAGGAFLAVMGINSLFGDGITVTEGFVKVPSIVGLEEEKAKKKLGKSELYYKLLASDYSPYVEVGVVSYQSPNAKVEVKKGTTVRYRIAVVSDEEAVVVGKNGNIDIESFVGMSVEHATELLENAGLKVVIEEEYSDEVDLGVVMEQDKTGVVHKGDTITLKVSKGSAAFDMINVKGMKSDDAESALNEIGLVVTFEYKNNNTVEEGYVISQNPEPGTSVMREDDITLVISSGKEIITVADVSGKDRDSAVDELKNQGFKVNILEEYNSDVKEGKISKIYPESGTSQEYGSEVTIFVSKGKKRVKVTYEAKGGTVYPKSETKYYTGTYGSLPTPTREGYVFSGWYTENGETEITNTTEVTYPDDHSIYAKWTAGKYTLSFETNGGDSVSPKGVNYDEKYGELPTPTKDGYTFAGWYNSQNDGTQVTSSTTVTTSGDHKLYAQWKANTYTIKFDGNGSTSGSTSELSITYDESKSLPANGFSKTGYTFNGWKDDNGNSYSDKQSVKNLVAVAGGSITLKAQWNIVTYHVNWNNGTGYTISVKRSKSPNKNASTGTLSNGADVFYGDVLSVSYTKEDYYTIKSYGKTSITVTGNVTSSDIYATAEQNPLSDWVEESSVPSNASVIEKKTQYRYRDKEFTSSNSSDLSGWNPNGSTVNSSGYYGNWSSWSTTNPQNGSSSREIQTKTETSEIIYTMRYWCTQEDTTYYRHYWSCYHSPERSTYGTHDSQDDLGTITWSASYLNGREVYSGNWSSGQYAGKNCSGTTGYQDDTGRIFFIVGQSGGYTTKYYRYRDYVDTSTTTYHYWRWKDWSSWSDNRPSENSNREIQEKTMCKYRKK